MDSETLSKQRLESYVQDEIMEWQIFNTEYVDTYKLACKVISIMNEKPKIEPYELGHSTLALLLDFYPCSKVFAFDEKDYYDFGKALLNARDWASEADEEDREEDKQREKENQDDDENASEVRTISLVGKSQRDLEHFPKEDVLNMCKALGLVLYRASATRDEVSPSPQKGKFTKSSLISEIFASKVSKITFISKFHRSLDLGKMEVSDLLFVLSHDQLMAVAEVVLCKQDYTGKSDEDVARTIKAKTKNSPLVGI